MFFVVASAVQAAAHTLPLSKALSGIFGSISLTAWICLLVRLVVVPYHWQPE
jgi:hypothetical protein